MATQKNCLIVVLCSLCCHYCVLLNFEFIHHSYEYSCHFIFHLHCKPHSLCLSSRVPFYLISSDTRIERQRTWIFFFCCSHFCLMYSLALIWRLCCTSNLNPWWCERISGFITFMILCCVEWMYGEYRSDSQAQLKSTNGKIHMTQRIKRKY